MSFNFFHKLIKVFHPESSLTFLGDPKGIWKGKVYPEHLMIVTIQALESHILYAVWLYSCVLNAAGNLAIGNNKIRALGGTPPTFKKLCIICLFSQTYNINRVFSQWMLASFDLHGRTSPPFYPYLYLAKSNNDSQEKKDRGKTASATWRGNWVFAWSSFGGLSNKMEHGDVDKTTS